MSRTLLRPLYAVALLTLVSGCTSNTWQTHAVPSNAEVADMLAGGQPVSQPWQLDEASYPQFTVPQNVRPCCAFGDMQKVKLGPVPVPFFRLNNVVGLSDIGPPKFASGIYHYTPSSSSVLDHGGSENNGILYTKQGGFIDLAHVRDTADDTIGLFFEILANLGKAHRIELPAELGPRYIEMKAFDVSALNDEQKWSVAAHLAARLAYFKAESHEIAQWHGYTSFSGWPETISAYSLEDLYSNMLGAKIVLNLIQQRKVLSEVEYNQNVSLWLNASLQELGIVDKAQAKEVLAAVDGKWWSSQASIPSKYMVLKRHYDLGDQQTPHLLTPELLGDQFAHLQPLARSSATVISLPAYAESLELDQVAKLVLEIEPRYAATFSHIPAQIWSDRIDHTEFPMIAQYAEQQDSKDLEALGVGND
ncbi:DUF4056 domain-containing protein [Photobacterium sanctipauli]|uniref:DUF4056 domain-containing protein n=1 Tax=Photobacterium sanctipauli TaxID=1342794 RepID=UPI000A68A158|nr:DUF4056 domain-containing protein [Photobacterium sanctipauli]